MKNKLLVLILAVISTACVGRKVREEVLQPAVRQAWIGVQADVLVGLNDAKAKGESIVMIETILVGFNSAMDEGNVSTLRVAWPNVRPYAKRGIDKRIRDGEISVGISISLLERVRKFEEALFKLAEREGTIHGRSAERRSRRNERGTANQSQRGDLIRGGESSALGYPSWSAWLRAGAPSGTGQRSVEGWYHRYTPGRRYRSENHWYHSGYSGGHR